MNWHRFWGLVCVAISLAAFWSIIGSMPTWMLVLAQVLYLVVLGIFAHRADSSAQKELFTSFTILLTLAFFSALLAGYYRGEWVGVGRSLMLGTGVVSGVVELFDWGAEILESLAQKKMGAAGKTKFNTYHIADGEIIQVDVDSADDADDADYDDDDELDPQADTGEYPAEGEGK